MSALRLFQVSPAFKRSCLGLSLVATVLAPTLGNAAESCKPTSDEKSVFMRALQTDLMVAALTCNSSDQYNTFIHQFQTVLKTDADHLRGYFKKTHGKAGAEDLNTFVTHLANDESEHSIQQGQGAYCDNAAKTFTAVLALPPAKVEDYAATLPITGEAPVRRCAVPAAAPAAASAAPVTNSAQATVPSDDN